MDSSNFAELIANDKKYNTMKKKLDIIATKKVLSSKLTMYDQKDLYIKAVALAEQICEYSKEKGYHDYYIKNNGYDIDQQDLNLMKVMVERLNEHCNNYEKNLLSKLNK